MQKMNGIMEKLDIDHDMKISRKEFDMMMKCMPYGGRAPRAIDRLHRYSMGFPPGSTRGKAYDNCMRRAGRNDRLPHKFLLSSC